MMIKKLKPSAPDGLVKSYTSSSWTNTGRDDYFLNLLPKALLETTRESSFAYICSFPSRILISQNSSLIKSFVFRFAVVNAEEPQKEASIMF